MTAGAKEVLMAWLLQWNQDYEGKWHLSHYWLSTRPPPHRSALAPRCGVLCCAVLCCAVLCCAVLCCAVLCCAVLCCAVLCCAVLSSLGIQPPALAESGVVQKAAAREKSLLVQAALSLDHLTLQNNIKTLHGYFITRACMRYKFE